MLNVFTDLKDFDLGIEDFDLPGSREINIYVLDEKMSALSLMEAFRACRFNPLRTYYYIPDTESNFAAYARDSISRGTVNLFSDLNELREALQGEVEDWKTYSIPDCISKTAQNFKVFVNPSTTTDLSVEVSAALRKNSCYTVATALLHMFQEKEPLLGTQFKEELEHTMAVSKTARKANEEFKLRGSQFLSVLAAENKEIDISRHTDEYNSMALHVMFQPLDPEQKNLKSRLRIITQLRKEKRG